MCSRSTGKQKAKERRGGKALRGTCLGLGGIRLGAASQCASNACVHIQQVSKKRRREQPARPSRGMGWGLGICWLGKGCSHHRAAQLAGLMPPALWQNRPITFSLIHVAHASCPPLPARRSSAARVVMESHYLCCTLCSFEGLHTLTEQANPTP